MTNPIIAKAVNILREGGLVAFPTETVYGLGADAKNPDAIRSVFTAKERPYDHPLIVHIADSASLSEWAREISLDTLKLANAFWPGPLTLVLKKQSHVLDLVTGGQDTVGIRVPKHSVAQALLQAFGSGIAAPSANRFTHISPTTKEAVIEELGDRINLILDGGACEVGLESTILDMTTEQPRILRPGMISAQMIEAVLNKSVDVTVKAEVNMRAPGMHHLHYAPLTKTNLIASEKISAFVQSNKLERIALLTHTDIELPVSNVERIKMPNDVQNYAHDLYHTLRTLDHQGFDCIMIESVPENKEWDAIRDRLLKASGSRT